MFTTTGITTTLEVNGSDKSNTNEEKHPTELDGITGSCYTTETLTQFNRMEESYTPQWSDMTGLLKGLSLLVQVSLVQL